MARKSRKSIKSTSVPVFATVIDTTSEILTMNAIESLPEAIELPGVDFPVISDAELEILNDMIVAEEAPETQPEPSIEPEAVHEDEAPAQAVADDEAPETFADITGALDPELVKQKVVAIGVSCLDRETFEAEKSAITGKDNIQGTLKKVRQNLVRTHAARVMLAANVSEGFINRELHDGSRYNVYALHKFSDLVDALTGNKLSNAINIAVVRTLFNFSKARATFDKTVALAAASESLVRTVPVGQRSMVVSHTVGASTAPTQASSTMQALMTLGVVRITGGTTKNPVYTVNSNAQARALEEVAISLAA